MTTSAATAARRVAATALIGLIAMAGLCQPLQAHAEALPERSAQWDLAALGYMSYDAIGETTTDENLRNVKRFQADRCLTADGVVGEKTSQALADLVKQLQTKAGVAADGQAGPGTKAGIAAWQKAHQLGNDGAAGPATMAAMGIVRAACHAPVPDRTVPCAAGTKDLGIQDGYVNGVLTPTRLCAVATLPSTDMESNPTSPFFIKGAEYRAIVASRVSGNVVKMVADAKADGIVLKARSSFRSMKRQQEIWGRMCEGRPQPCGAAKPGTSPHQQGEALDLNTDGVFNDKTYSCATKATVDTPQYAWLVEHSHAYGFHQYAREPWHWDTADNYLSC